MRDHPIPPVTEALQYRAIGIVRGIYAPLDPKKFTRGRLIDSQGIEIEAVVLGRVLNLMRRHVPLDDQHLWVVYPRCRETNFLHLQIAGIWEPSKLHENIPNENKSNNEAIKSIDEIQEGDDYFSIRGELIYTRPDSNDLVIKIRQKPRQDGKRAIPFKLQLKGEVPLEYLRNFVSLDVRRFEQSLHVESYEIIGKIPNRTGKKKAGVNVNDAMSTNKFRSS